MMLNFLGIGKPYHQTMEEASNVLPMTLQVDIAKLMGGLDEYVQAGNLLIRDVMVLGYLEKDPTTVRIVIAFQHSQTLRIVAIPWDFSLQFLRELGALVSENGE